MDKKIFIKKLDTLLNELDFSEDVHIEAIDYISKNYEFIKSTAKVAYEGDWDSYLLKLENPYLSLMTLIYKIVDLEEVYKSRGLPRSVLLDTLSDLKLRKGMYFKEHSKLGLTDEDIVWLKHIYYLNIFKLGVLQYEFGLMSYEECIEEINLEKIKQIIPKGCNVLRIHIMRGVSLSSEDVDESFKFSKEFFKTYFPNYNYSAYTCSSWMLYSKNKFILPQSSRILAFTKRFEMICETKRKDMPIKYIFLREYKTLEEYPRETSLQRNALNNLENLGVGFGLIYKEKIK